MVYPLRTLLCAAVLACAAAEFARSSHFLNTVLGSRHTAQLGLKIEDMEAMLAEAHEASVDGLQRTYIACSTLTDSANAAAVLENQVGEDNKQTVYSSRGRNMACWAIRATAAQAKVLAADQLIQSVTVLPSEAKIHFNVHEYFEHQLQGKVASGEGWKRAPVQAEQAVLKVEFGLGTSKGMQGIDMLEAFASWRDATSGAANGLRAAAEEGGLNARGRWKEVQQLTRAQQAQSLRDGSRGRCDLSRLDVEAHEYTLEVRGLAALGSSSQGMSCLGQLVEAAAADHRVVRVLIAPEPKLLNNNARGITQSGTVGDEPFGADGLNGAGQIVGVADSGLDDLSCFFVDTSASPIKTPRSTKESPQTYPTRRKVIQYVAHADGRDDEQGHGTHVCGSVAGSISSADYNGMASGAKLAFFDIGKTGLAFLSVPSLYNYVFPAAYGAGARIHTNSWGSSYQACDSRCYDIDRYTYQKQDFAVLFAASNDGSYGYFSIGNPAISKNCITVGATETSGYGPGYSSNDLAYFSSIGPTFDNRIKPDVVAPGYWIYSARASADGETQTCSNLPMAGTSMATPVTAGNAALIRQYFEDEAFWEANCNSNYANCGAFSPSGVLLKAMLINSGQGIAMYAGNVDTVVPTQSLGAPPDYFQGYGRVLLNNVLSVDGINDFDLFVLDSYAVNSDSTVELTVTITDTSVPLRVTMSWYDPPTTAYTSKQVLHDLDLLVVAPDGTTTFWGNGVEFGDEYNNNEKVFVESPVAGVYTVKVHAYPFTDSASQNIALVITSGGEVSGPTTGATWEYDLSDRDCADAETILNLIDLAGDTWGLGKFLAISDDATDEIVYLGFSAKGLTETSACLPKDACYTAQLSLAELYGYDDEIEASQQVVAEVSACTYLLYQGVEEYSFCLDAAGACDYCHGAFEMNVAWEGSISNNKKSQSFWLVYDVDAAGTVTGERYGASAVSTDARKVCLDEGLYILQTASAPKGVKVDFDACGVKLANGETACVKIEDGECTFSDVCEDISNPDAAVPTWSGLGVASCVVALLAAVLLAN